MKFASPFCGCARETEPEPNPLELDSCLRETSLDTVLPIAILLGSLALNVCRRYKFWKSDRYPRAYEDTLYLRLPTAKDAALLRRSLAMLVLILLEISCWAFLFAWRLESAILERGQDPGPDAKCGTPLYQVLDPGLALIPRMYMLILVIKSFTTPADPVSPSKFTLYNPHFLLFYTVASLSAILRSFSYFVTASGGNWLTSSTIERSFAAIDMVVCFALWAVSATTPGELDQGELLDIEDDDDGILVLHDGRVVRNGRILSFEASASPLSAITFSWMNSLLHSAYRKPLDSAQLWALPLCRRAQENYKTFRQTMNSNHLVWRIYQANRKAILFQLVTAFAAVIFHYANPFFLLKLLRYIQDPQGLPTEAGYLYCIAIFVCNVISTLVASQTLLWGRRWHVSMNNMLNSEIYAHTLRLRHPNADTASKLEDDQEGELDESSANRQASLMSQDTEHLAELASYLHIFYTCPLEITAGVVFLYYILGNAFLAGLIVMVVALPSTHYINRRLVQVQKQLAESKAWRIRLLRELVESIRTTKFLAWESKWMQIIMNARDDELVGLIKLYTQNTILTVIWFATPVFVTTISFAWYTLVEKNRLDPSTAFVSIVLFGMLRDPLNVMPQAFMAYNDAKVSLGHINAFLNSGDKRDSDSDSSNPSSVIPYDEQVKIGFESSVFQWPTDDREPKEHIADPAAAQSPFLLTVPAITFPPGALSIITGRRRSGKTSLLLALLGDMNTLSGQAFLPRRYLTKQTRNVRDQVNEALFVFRVAYVAQVPWIQQGTIRENILFFEPWDDARYRTVLYQCDLLRDLSMMENGDLTCVGERGLPIPEILKHKVSLARAVYSRAKTLLIDDVFSVMDRHTIAFLHEKCIRGSLMEGRTVILATTHIGPWARGAKLLVGMDAGNIVSTETEDGIIDWIEANQLRADGLTTDDMINDDRIESFFDNDILFGEDDMFEEGSIMRESIRLTEDGNPVEAKTKRLAYSTYFSACGGWRFWSAAVLFTVLARLSCISESYWLKIWSMAGQQLGIAYTTLDVETPMMTVNRYVLVYLILCLITVTCNFLRTVVQYRGSLRASSQLFSNLLHAVLHAPLQFFDTVPPGQIMSRFSKDIETVDSNVGWHVNFLLQSVLGVLGVVITIGIFLPEFYLACLIAALMYFYIGTVYIRASRQLKKVHAESRPPIYSLYTDTLAGLATIRAYGEERSMMSKMFHLLDENMRPFYTLWTTNRWLFVRVEVLGATLSLFIGCLLIYKSTDAGLAGIALTFAASLLEYVYWLMRQSTTVDMHFEAIERINEYIEMPQEPPSIVEGSRPPAAWPTSAGIQVRDLTVTLSTEHDFVLKHVSFNIAPGEKVCIVGRAGGEKNVLVSCLFRFVEPVRGSIKIDGVNIAWIGVKDLRSRITYISKEGDLLSRTVRSNLDPFGEYDDYELWQALYRTHLAQPNGVALSKYPPVIHDLDMDLGKDGVELSVCDRQLLCIARAILRDCTRLVVLEEAELSAEEQEKLQHVIRDEFEDSTMILIPLRLKHIPNYDRVMVFDQGILAECDTPENLLENSQSLLRSMMERAEVLDNVIVED